MNKNSSQSTQKTVVPLKDKTDKYEFVENVSISGTIYLKGSFIELTKDQLKEFSSYVTQCSGECKSKGDCVRC